MITHYDLFAGIGGFSIALEEVFNEPIRHIFCEWEQFPTSVLRQHWPEGEYWGDIAELVADTERKGWQGQGSNSEGQHGQRNRTRGNQEQDWTIVTGGFPCQPFSHAGRRKGTDDHRYLWPEMLRVVQLTNPQWVIAENVRGLTNWSDGLVLETVCADLESEGYEVQPFIIPAVAVGAPHRRDRVWIVAHTKHGRPRGAEPKGNGTPQSIQGLYRQEYSTTRQSERTVSHRVNSRYEYPDWGRSWQEVAFATCDDSVDDGLSRLVDGVPISRAKWRKDSLKAYGNGIVPQVAIEIMKAIKEAT